MNENWAAVLEAARELPREQRRWIGHELLKTDIAVGAHGDEDKWTVKYAAEKDWAINKGLDCETLIQHFRRNAKTGESSEPETVFANYELFANV